MLQNLSTAQRHLNQWVPLNCSLILLLALRSCRADDKVEAVHNSLTTVQTTRPNYPHATVTVTLSPDISFLQLHSLSNLEKAFSVSQRKILFITEWPEKHVIFQCVVYCSYSGILEIFQNQNKTHLQWFLEQEYLCNCTHIFFCVTKRLSLHYISWFWKVFVHRSTVLVAWFGFQRKIENWK